MKMKCLRDRPLGRPFFASPRIWLLFICLVLVIACGQTPVPGTPTTSQPGSDQPPSATLSQTQPSTFTIALEYAIPGLASAYAPTGLTYAKPQPIFGLWGLIEPSPGEPNWDPLDNLVHEYQAAGFSGTSGAIF